MNKKEKLELYNKAKEAYYNGQEIMTDFEFDQLEKELGLENKSFVGTRHNPSYTIVHPFMMGSLSKVQIHKDKYGAIDWTKYYNEVLKYVGLHANLIVTPKYDGCSFECEIKDHEILQISSRGDGEYGKDLTNHLTVHIPSQLINMDGHNVFRGEVLVKKSIFEKKYSEKFTNPRSFVSGVLNRDYENTTEVNEMINDLSIIVYDWRSIENGQVTDHDWTGIAWKHVKEAPLEFLPDFFYDTYFGENTGDCVADFENLYEQFANYRHNCDYALDGFVIKPNEDFREPSLDERRPKDCVAIKFIPMLEETEVVNITWNLGKTHEYTPIIWVKPVEMDGRMVAKCSGHNYGFLKEKGITIGAKIIMSLAGDIIPFMYKVTQENPNGEIPMPTEYGTEVQGVHLMAMISEEDRIKYQFINSASALNIPTIGEQTAKEIFTYMSSEDQMTNEFFGIIEQKKAPFNILLCTPEDIYYGAGQGKTGLNAQKAFKKVLENITLNDIIKSCNFRFCGNKVTEAIVEYLLTGNGNWEHLATEGYLWVLTENSWQWREVNKILEHLGKTVEDFKVKHEEAKTVSSNQIPVILTGEPTNYKSKGEFLKLNPQYRMTTSWKEVQIVFTNSLESKTGKMKKAIEKNIKIELY